MAAKYYSERMGDELSGGFFVHLLPVIIVIIIIVVIIVVVISISLVVTVRRWDWGASHRDCQDKTCNAISPSNPSYQYSHVC